MKGIVTRVLGWLGFFQYRVWREVGTGRLVYISPLKELPIKYPERSGWVELRWFWCRPGAPPRAGGGCGRIVRTNIAASIAKTAEANIPVRCRTTSALATMIATDLNLAPPARPTTPMLTRR